MPVRAKESFAFSEEDGSITVINSDDVYADDHPAVKARPAMFRDIAEDPVIAAPVEQATANPGEKRAAKRSE